MEFEILDQLSESRIFRDKKTFAKFSDTELNDLLYSYLLAVNVLVNEETTKETSLKYLSKATVFNDYSLFRIVCNDLYMLIHAQAGNKYFNIPKFRLFVKSATVGFSLNLYQYFSDVETQLKIKHFVLKNLKRPISKWESVEDNRKSKYVTELIVVIGNLSPLAEILTPLRELKEKYHVR